MSIFKELSIVLYSVHWYMYNMFILKVKFPYCSLGKSVNTTSMLELSYRWICSIVRHSRRFSSIEAPSAV